MPLTVIGAPPAVATCEPTANIVGAGVREDFCGSAVDAVGGEAGADEIGNSFELDDGCGTKTGDV